MPEGKHFDIVEKINIMAWHFGNEPAKEITTRLNRDLTVHRNIPLKKDLSITATLMPPKE
jgi:hypothetical protein